MLDQKIILQRLAFIRYLYNLAVEQSRRPQQLAAASILTFHDSVELFLLLACEHLDVKKKAQGFMDYWDIFADRLPGDGLTQKGSMRRFNKARGGLKHQGISPSMLDIESFRASVTNFFEENTLAVFKVVFDAISMVDLVQYDKARVRLQKAQSLLEKGESENALGEIAFAFAHLFDDYWLKRWDELGHSPFFLGKRTYLDKSFSMGTEGYPSRLEEFRDAVVDSVDAIQNVLKVISVGIDYRRYAKFLLLTPEVFSQGWGGYGSVKQKRLPTTEECRFCLDFVVESAIHLQDFGGEIGSETQ